jgi:hypothetical protein
MDAAYISAFAALGGSAVGAFASFTTTWLTLNSQERANRSARAVTRRENLYGEFIEEVAKHLPLASTSNSQFKLKKLNGAHDGTPTIGPSEILGLA